MIGIWDGFMTEEQALKAWKLFLAENNDEIVYELRCQGHTVPNIKFQLQATSDEVNVPTYDDEVCDDD